MMRILFTYWGRRGAMTPFIRALAATCASRDDIEPIWSFSTSFEAFSEFAAGAVPMVPIETFSRSRGALLHIWRIPRIRAAIREAMKTHRPDAVVVLMPHVWTPFVSDLFRISGAKYVSLVHDAKPHPGDPTAIVTPWLVAAALRADIIVTLSHATARSLSPRVAPPRLLVNLGNPTYGYSRLAPASSDTLRVLFFGRVLPYKGLDLLVEAVARARARGARIALGVAGEGSLSAELRAKLEALDAEVISRWIGEDEASGLFGRYDVLALPYRTSSQSGVASAALAAGMPVVATPVGGLPEQVVDGFSGLLAAAVTADAIADALVRLAGDRALVVRLGDGAKLLSKNTSMSGFVDRLRGTLRG